jgi:mono/diheme cytochrome c family protein
MTRSTFRILVLAGVLAPAAPAWAAETVPSAADVEFFESKVRPLFVAHCNSCHTAGKDKGGLNMAARDGMLKGGDSGPAVVPGKPDDSPLIRAVHYRGETKMPPKGKLKDAEIEILTLWVKRGAPWPSAAVVGGDAGVRATTNDKITAADRDFWSFRPVTEPPLPPVKQAAWPVRPLDRFVLAKLEQQGLTPGRDADRRALIRRVTFDLTGLPPTPEEVEAFLADTSSEAYARLVDRLLASPRYGERWGRHWLDVARYGEDQAHTFQARLFPEGWRYRDWVVNALNRDMPYDRFILEQLAGDLLTDGDEYACIAATGFLATGPHYYMDAGEAKVAEAAELDDRVDTVARGFLGLTVACARCHDHKFDPIPTKDYYSLAGVFKGANYRETPLAPPDVVAAYEKRLKAVKDAEEAVKKYAETAAPAIRERMLGRTADALVAAWKIKGGAKVEKLAKDAGLNRDFLEKWLAFVYPAGGKVPAGFEAWRRVADASKPGDEAALRKAADAVQAELLDAYRQSLAYSKANDAERKAKKLTAPAKAVMDRLNALTDKRTGPINFKPDKVEAVLDDAGKKELKALNVAIEAAKKSLNPPPFAHALTEGQGGDMRVYIRGNVNKEGDVAPRRFLRVLAGDEPPRFTQGSGRLELARTIASKDNPLTARVIVNRVWAWHFGRGLVSTPSNFGKLGARPTHPELLDYLATFLVKNGWSLKALHREILLSATYRLSSDTAGPGAKTDPSNQWLWRFNRQRLDAEAFRDALLAAAGTLDLTTGGPSQELNDAGNRRRTLYAKVSRHNLNGLLRLFDFPDPNLTSEARPVTIVPLQQLFVMNSPFMTGQAKAVAKRAQAATADESGRVRAAYRLVYSRPASDAEVEGAIEFLRSPEEPGTPAPGLSRWEQLAQALLASNEFCFVD